MDDARSGRTTDDDERGGRHQLDGPLLVQAMDPLVEGLRDLTAKVVAVIFDLGDCGVLLRRDFVPA